MAEERGQALRREMVDDLVYPVEEYWENGFEIVSVVGRNGSPPNRVTRIFNPCSDANQLAYTCSANQSIASSRVLNKLNDLPATAAIVRTAIPSSPVIPTREDSFM